MMIRKFNEEPIKNLIRSKNIGLQRDPDHSNRFLNTRILASFQLILPCFRHGGHVIVFVQIVVSSNNNLQLHIALYLCNYSYYL
jgi:hypothetical protein